MPWEKRGISQAENVILIMVILFFYAVAFGGMVVLPISLQADYFGRRAFATIRGLVHTVQTVGLVLGPIAAGLAYDITGSYVQAFIGFAAASFLGTLLVMGLLKPVLRPTAPTEARRV